MAGPTQVDVNASGHIFQEAEEEEKGNGTAGEILALGDVIYMKAVDSKLWKYAAASEATCAAIVGVADGAYAAEATAYYFKDGGIIPSGLTLTAGAELWAASAVLDTYANVVSTKWTRRMGVAKSTSSAQISMGDVQQKP